MLSNQTGASNSVVGVSALRDNVDGSFNTAVGKDALMHNSASGNTATGAGALSSNATGELNTANGALALAIGEV